MKKTLLEKANSVLPDSPESLMNTTFWIAKTFKKYVCVKFASSEEDSSKCALCKLPKSHHERELNKIGGSDSSEEETQSVLINDIKCRDNFMAPEPTDAFGEVDFQGYYTSKRAKYIRLAHDTSPELTLKLFSKWGMSLPQLLISVFGSHDFKLPKRIKKPFSEGLIKVASTSGAWLFTSGVNKGASGIVGEAIRNHHSVSQQLITAVGITCWNGIEGKEDLQNNIKPNWYAYNSASSGMNLEANHTHFLLVDNGREAGIEVEADFRIKLENYIAHQGIKGIKCNVPVVCLVLEGGVNEIIGVGRALNQGDWKVPVVLVEGTGGATDLIALAYKDPKNTAVLREKFEAIFMDKGYTMDEKDGIFTSLMDIVTSEEKRKYLTIHSFNNSQRDLDDSILQALHNSSTDQNKIPISLSIAWDRVDVARRLIEGRAITKSTLTRAMMEALKKDKVEFVKLFLENGINMNRFLTAARLEELYNYEIKKSKTNESSPSLLHMLYVCCPHLKEIENFTLLHVAVIFEKMMGNNFLSFYRKLYPEAKTENYRSSDDIELSSITSDNEAWNRKRFDKPFNELLIWAVLTKHHKMALFFCKQGEEAIAKALVASKLYLGMADVCSKGYDENGSTILKEQCQIFQDLSVDLLDACFNTNQHLSHRLCLCVMPHWNNQMLMSLAMSSQNSKFISHPACQSLLTNLWLGYFAIGHHNLLKKIIMMSCAFFPPFLFLLDYRTHIGHSEVDIQISSVDHDENLFGSMDSLDSIESTDFPKTAMRKRSSMDALSFKTYVSVLQNNWEDVIAPRPPQNLTMFQKAQAFYCAPSCNFYRNLMIYFTFLVFFTFVVLTSPLSRQWNDWGISYLQYFCTAFVISQIFEEIRRFIALKTSGSIWNRLKEWYKLDWVVYDSAAFFFFLIGAIICMISADLNMPIAEIGKIAYVGRVSLAISSIFFFIRIFEFYKDSEYYGPYITMLSKMKRDTIFFVVILMVFLIAYGVSSTAILYPFEEISSRTLHYIFFVPYWQFYGELFLDQRGPNFCELTQNEAGNSLADICSAANPNCTEEHCVFNEDCHPYCEVGKYMGPFMLALFLIVSNILLLNVLIAIYSNIFQSIQVHSTEIWKCQRYELVMKYSERPVLVPPFIIITHIYLIIKWIVYKYKGIQYKNKTPELNLEGYSLEILQQFEISCVDQYCREQSNRLAQQTDQKIKKFCENFDRFTTAVETKEQSYQIENEAHKRKVEVALEKCQELNVEVKELKTLVQQSMDKMEVVLNILQNKEETD